MALSMAYMRLCSEVARMAISTAYLRLCSEVARMAMSATYLRLCSEVVRMAMSTAYQRVQLMEIPSSHQNQGANDLLESLYADSPPGRTVLRTDGVLLGKL